MDPGNDEGARRAVVGAYAVVKEAVRGRGPRRQALLYIPAALRARRIWRAAPGARKRVWRWTGASKKFWKFFRPTTVARSARERGGLLVVRSQGVMACKAQRMDCQAVISVVVYWCVNVLIGHGLADCKSCLYRWLRGGEGSGADADHGNTICVHVSVPLAS